MECRSYSFTSRLYDRNRIFMDASAKMETVADGAQTGELLCDHRKIEKQGGFVQNQNSGSLWRQRL